MPSVFLVFVNYVLEHCIPLFYTGLGPSKKFERTFYVHSDEIAPLLTISILAILYNFNAVCELLAILFSKRYLIETIAV